MPKELARVMDRYDVLRKQVNPLLSQLQDHTNDFVIMRDGVWIMADELAKRLKELKVPNAADPKAAKDPQVQNVLDDLEKYKTLMGDRDSQMREVAKKLTAVHTELVKLEKDVAAVIKAKSGFFTRSKSLPQLKALSVSLHKFADDVETAASSI